MHDSPSLSPTTAQPAVHEPGPSRPFWIGGGVGVSVLLWSCVGIAHAAHGDGTTVIVILGIAVTATIVAVLLGLSYVQQRANSDEHAAVLAELRDIGDQVAEIGEVRAELADVYRELKQLREHVQRIDPWTIYTAVAADVLGQDVTKRGD